MSTALSCSQGLIDGVLKQKGKSLWYKYMFDYEKS